MGATLKGKNLLPHFGNDKFFPLRVVPMVNSNIFHVCYSLFMANNIIFLRIFTHIAHVRYMRKKQNICNTLYAYGHIIICNTRYAYGHIIICNMRYAYGHIIICNTRYAYGHIFVLQEGW